MTSSKSILRLTLIPVVLCLVSMSASAQNFDAVKRQVRTYTLPNGMKFIVLERHDAPVAAFHVYADVGSANDAIIRVGVLDGPFHGD
jgi:hypothetical protein